ncbi:MAG: DUF373 family protein [Crenarchaeota archaeon]|nr:DUF373 family protein [Thermoproteota archaeon]
MSVPVRKILVLCIDRDNDVGSRLGIPTPVIGREQLLNVAVQYILRYPDDSDANAMFGAIQLYDNLVASLGRENVEVALVTGAESEDTMADLKLLGEVDIVLARFNADAIIVVSDGPADEAVVPLLQSRRPVISVRRIVVRQSRGFEEFAVLAKYYLTKLFVEPKYRKYALGLPGLILLLYGIASIVASNLPSIVAALIGSIIALLIGVGALLFAFNIHEKILSFIRRYELTFFTIVVSAMLLILYPLVNIYVLGVPLRSIILTRPTIFDVLSIAIAIALFTNIVEIYAKKGIIPVRKVVTSIAVSLFPALVINGMIWFILKVITFSEFVGLVTGYIVINIIAIGLALRLLRRYHEKGISYPQY